MYRLYISRRFWKDPNPSALQKCCANTIKAMQRAGGLINGRWHPQTISQDILGEFEIFIPIGQQRMKRNHRIHGSFVLVNVEGQAPYILVRYNESKKILLAAAREHFEKCLEEAAEITGLMINANGRAAMQKQKTSGLF